MHSIAHAFVEPVNRECLKSVNSRHDVLRPHDREKECDCLFQPRSRHRNQQNLPFRLADGSSPLLFQDFKGGWQARFSKGQGCSFSCGTLFGIDVTGDKRERFVGTYQQAGQHAVTFLAGGSSPGGCPLRRGVATEVFTPGDAAGSPNRQGSHGTQTRRQFVLDVAQAMELRTGYKVRFARGTVRLRPWCEVNHRPLDWASRSLRREFEVVIMIDVATGEMVGSD